MQNNSLTVPTASIIRKTITVGNSGIDGVGVELDAGLGVKVGVGVGCVALSVAIAMIEVVSALAESFNRSN